MKESTDDDTLIVHNRSCVQKSFLLDCKPNNKLFTSKMGHWKAQKIGKSVFVKYTKKLCIRKLLCDILLFHIANATD